MGFAFTAGDLEICKLLAYSSTAARTPWSYEYLATSWFAPLLGRGAHHIPARLRDLSSRPHCYLAKPDQPRTNCRDIVYALDRKGADEVRERDIPVSLFPRRKLSHSLMCNLVAASFELASRQVPCVAIDATVQLPKLTVIPDWHPFRLSAPAGVFTVFIEADIATETLSANGNANTIEGKFVEYLRIAAAHVAKRPLFVFVTTRRTRMESMIELLKRVIDRAGYDHSYAGHFAFTHIAYDRFLNSIPKPSPWAVVGSYYRAGFPPINLADERNSE